MSKVSSSPSLIQIKEMLCRGIPPAKVATWLRARGEIISGKTIRTWAANPKNIPPLDHLPKHLRETFLPKLEAEVNALDKLRSLALLQERRVVETAQSEFRARELDPFFSDSSLYKEIDLLARLYVQVFDKEQSMGLHPHKLGEMEGRFAFFAAAPADLEKLPPTTKREILERISRTMAGMAQERKALPAPKGEEA